MGHASDCALHDGPAFLPGPCDCGLDPPVDPHKTFVPWIVLGTRGGRWEVRQRNIEAFIEAHTTPTERGVRVTLAIDLIDAHRWPLCGSEADDVNLHDAVVPVIGKGEALAAA